MGLINVLVLYVKHTRWSKPTVALNFHYQEKRRGSSIKVTTKRVSFGPRITRPDERDLPRESDKESRDK